MALYFHCTLARNAVNSAPLPFPRNFWGLETVRALRGSVATHAGIRAGKEERLALGMRPLFLLFNFLFCALFGAKEANSSSRSTSSMPRSSTDTGPSKLYEPTGRYEDTATRAVRAWSDSADAKFLDGASLLVSRIQISTIKHANGKMAFLPCAWPLACGAFR